MSINTTKKDFIQKNGIIYSSDMTELIKILPECRLSGKFTVVSTVKCVHNKAFDNCDVEEIDFGNAEIIDDDACFNCQKLKSVHFEKNAIEISPKALSFCESIERITINEFNRKYKSIDGVVFTRNLQLFLFPSGRKGNYIVPDGTTEIADYAFYFSQLSEITFPDTLTTIGDLAFENSKTKKISFSNTALNIGYRAFSCCENLTEISLADNSIVADCAFINCSSLKKVNYNSDNVIIGKNAFQHTPFFDSFYEGLTITDVSDLNIGNIEDMSKKELEKLISSIEDEDCKIITLVQATGYAGGLDYLLLLLVFILVFLNSASRSLNDPFSWNRSSTSSAIICFNAVFCELCCDYSYEDCTQHCGSADYSDVFRFFIDHSEYLPFFFFQLHNITKKAESPDILRKFYQ